MDYADLWAIISIAWFFTVSVMNFRKCDWNLKKEYLSAKNRAEWQKRRAFLQLGIACLGTMTMLSDYLFHNSIMIVVFSGGTLFLFILFLINEGRIKK